MHRLSQAHEPTFSLTEDQKRLAIGGGVLIVAIAAVLALLPSAGTDPEARAFAALADSAGPAHRSARAEVKDVPLPDGSVARLGAGATLATNTTFGEHVRAIHVGGPVSLSLRSDSAAPVAIQVGEHRFVTAGAVAAFGIDAAGLVLVQVDSGDLVLARDSVRARLVAGSVVRIGSGTPMPLARDQRDAAFGWRQGRLQLSGAPLSAITRAVRDWYDVELRFPPERALSDTASLDVPLASRDSLAAELGTALRARVERAGDRMTFWAAAVSPSRREAATPAARRPGATAPLAPPSLTLPTIPPSP